MALVEHRPRQVDERPPSAGGDPTLTVVAVFPFVVDLGEYPRWLPLVHTAEPDGEAPEEDD